MDKETLQRVLDALAENLNLIDPRMLMEIMKDEFPETSFTLDSSGGNNRIIVL